MMPFTTPVEIPEVPWKIGYQSKNILLGSCFTENIGNRLKELCFDVDLNPFGIQYNPASIALSLKRLLIENPFKASDLSEYNGLWHSFMHHGHFSSFNQQETLDRINERFNTSVIYLRNADFLFITLGTAWIYELRKSGTVVANCHKIPSTEFRRFRLTTPETVNYLMEALEILWGINPSIKVIFTVSPVRHTADGAIENQRSKATLLLAADALINGFGKNRCAYFPSFEIVMDELRDYRFYADDMVHLSTIANEFVWDKFESAVIDKNDHKLIHEIKRLTKAASHRPFRQTQKTHQQFIRRNLEKIDQLEQKYPYINLTELKKTFNQQLTD